mgnify:CR=1 FL=1
MFSECQLKSGLLQTACETQSNVLSTLFLWICNAGVIHLPQLHCIAFLSKMNKQFKSIWSMCHRNETIEICFGNTPYKIMKEKGCSYGNQFSLNATQHMWQINFSTSTINTYFISSLTYLGTENSNLPNWKNPVCHYTLGKEAREYNARISYEKKLC